MDVSHTLAVHRFLLRASLSIGTMFAWVLIFHALYVGGETESGALLLTALAYSFLQLLIFFITPLSARNVRYGTIRSMILASLAQAAAFLWLAASATEVFGNQVLNVWWGITGYVFLTGIYRALYWVPYSIVGLSSRGHWSARTRFLLEVLLALTPVAVAIVITGSADGAWLALTGAGIFAFVSSLVLISVPDSYERFSWGYTETIRVLFSRENKKLFGSSFLEGLQGAGLLFLWPLTIFMLFNWSYITLGTLLSMTFLLVILLRRSFQRVFRHFSLHDNHRFHAAITSSAWVLRLVVFSPFAIVIADVLQHATVPARRLGLDPIAMEQAADSTHYIDEYTALKEMGNSLGRIFACGALVIGLMYAEPIVALALALILVAVASIIHLYQGAEEEAI